MQCFSFVVSLAFFRRILVVNVSNMLFFSKSQMSKVSDVFLHYGFFILQLNVREHIIPHIPCGKVSEDNYCLFYASHLK